MLIYDLIKQPHAYFFIQIDYDELYGENSTLSFKTGTFLETLGYSNIYFLYDSYHVFNVTRLLEYNDLFSTIIKNANSQYYPFIFSNVYESEPYYRSANILTQNFGFSQLPLLPLTVKSTEVIFYGNVDHHIVANRNIKPAVYMLEGKVLQTCTETDPNYLLSIYAAPFLPIDLREWNPTTQQTSPLPIKLFDDRTRLLSIPGDAIYVRVDRGMRFIILTALAEGTAKLSYNFAVNDDVIYGVPTLFLLKPGPNLLDLENTFWFNTGLRDRSAEANFRYPFSQASTYEYSFYPGDLSGGVGVWDNLGTDGQVIPFDTQFTRCVMTIRNFNPMPIRMTLGTFIVTGADPNTDVESRALFPTSRGTLRPPLYIGAQYHPNAQIEAFYTATAKANNVKMQGYPLIVPYQWQSCVVFNAFSTWHDFVKEKVKIILEFPAGFDKSQLYINFHAERFSRSLGKLNLAGKFMQAEGVDLNESLSPLGLGNRIRGGLVLEGAAPTSIEARGNYQGLYLDWQNNPGAARVVVCGDNGNQGLLDFPYPTTATSTNLTYHGTAQNLMYFWWGGIASYVQFQDWGAPDPITGAPSGIPRIKKFVPPATTVAQDISTQNNIFHLSTFIDRGNVFINRVPFIPDVVYTVGNSFKPRIPPGGELSAWNFKFVYQWSEHSYERIFESTTVDPFIGALNAMNLTGRFFPPFPNIIRVKRFRDHVWPQIKHNFYGSVYNLQNFAMLVIEAMLRVNIEAGYGDLGCVNCHNTETYYFEPHTSYGNENYWLQGRVRCNTCKKYWDDVSKNAAGPAQFKEQAPYIIKRVHDIIVNDLLDLADTSCRIQIVQYSPSNKKKLINRKDTYYLTTDPITGEQYYEARLDNLTPVYPSITLNSRLLALEIQFPNWYNRWYIPNSRNTPVLIDPLYYSITGLVSDKWGADKTNPTNITWYYNFPNTSANPGTPSSLQYWNPFKGQASYSGNQSLNTIFTTELIDFYYIDIYENNVWSSLNDVVLWDGLFAEGSQNRVTWSKKIVDNYRYYFHSFSTLPVPLTGPVPVPSSLDNICFPFYDFDGYMGVQFSHQSLFKVFESQTGFNFTTIIHNFEFAIIPQWYYYLMVSEVGTERLQWLINTGLFLPANSATALRQTWELFQGAPDLPDYASYYVKTQSWTVIARCPHNSAINNFFGLTATTDFDVVRMIYKRLNPWYVPDVILDRTEECSLNRVLNNSYSNRGPRYTCGITGLAFKNTTMQALNYSWEKKDLYSLATNTAWTQTEFSWSHTTNVTKYYMGAPMPFKEFDLPFYSIDEYLSDSQIEAIPSLDNPVLANIINNNFDATIFAQSKYNPGNLFATAMNLSNLATWVNVFPLKEPARLWVLYSRNPDPQNNTNMSALIDLGTQLLTSISQGYAVLPMKFRPAVLAPETAKIYSFAIEDTQGVVSAVFCAREELIGNKDSTETTLLNRLARAHWVITPAFHPHNFKSYSYEEFTPSLSGQFWDKRYLIDESHAVLELGYKYATYPFYNDYAVTYQKQNLQEIIVPRPGTFSFHLHFECETRAKTVVLLDATPFFSYVEQVSPTRFISKSTFSLCNFANIAPNAAFYVHVVFANRAKLVVQVYVNSVVKGGQPQLAYFNSPTNYAVIRQDNLHNLTQITFVFTELVTASLIKYLLICTDASS